MNSHPLLVGDFFFFSSCYWWSPRSLFFWEGYWTVTFIQHYNQEWDSRRLIISNGFACCTLILFVICFTMLAKVYLFFFSDWAGKFFNLLKTLGTRIRVACKFFFSSLCPQLRERYIRGQWITTVVTSTNNTINNNNKLSLSKTSCRCYDLVFHH